MLLKYCTVYGISPITPAISNREAMTQSQKECCRALGRGAGRDFVPYDRSFDTIHQLRSLK